jgi:hypothetical protein
MLDHSRVEIFPAFLLSGTKHVRAPQRWPIDLLNPWPTHELSCDEAFHKVAAGKKREFLHCRRN